MTTAMSTALVPAAPVLTNAERLALAGFLAGYGGLTREAYQLDLRQYASWCQQHHLRLFQARRADIAVVVLAVTVWEWVRAVGPDWPAPRPQHAPRSGTRPLPGDHGLP